ncbi:hypothetical protein J120_03285 [candidate division TM6 bacterium JCVI TM6SC1]|jgi:large subunit ribosomal protein L15|uniref:Large ribosomal subunit protein uL15 n=1 Tax=candidate division TM6 bacterium JCVI TM6SC1 TaxID=1306947 RepID=A0A0D2K501_9BACT|nr:hypothetical protein J120_03285 [candidate division TM6 bacterium JCVI TM6SC1]
MAQLSEISPLVKKRKRVGRGGDRGGTSGRGGKGQTARSGGMPRLGFEGGQMPLYRRSPKRGFNNYEFQKEVLIVNLEDLENNFQAGQTVNLESLSELGLVKARKSIPALQQVLKILGTGTLTKKLNVHADAFSESARLAIENAGGVAQTTKES